MLAKSLLALFLHAPVKDKDYFLEYQLSHGLHVINTGLSQLTTDFSGKKVSSPTGMDQRAVRLGPFIR